MEIKELKKWLKKKIKECEKNWKKFSAIEPESQAYYWMARSESYKNVLKQFEVVEDKKECIVKAELCRNCKYREYDEQLEMNICHKAHSFVEVCFTGKCKDYEPKNDKR